MLPRQVRRRFRYLFLLLVTVGAPVLAQIDLVDPDAKPVKKQAPPPRPAPAPAKPPDEVRPSQPIDLKAGEEPEIDSPEE